jgi:hypothetical protein
MKIVTQYSYENSWKATSEEDLLRIIKEEVGFIGAEGTLEYVKESCAKDKIITVGSCRFKKEE